jgi:hypothetical protein
VSELEYLESSDSLFSRAIYWGQLLQCSGLGDLCVDSVVCDLPNQRVVRFDTKRTRGMVFDKEVHESLQLFLTFYSKHEKLNYKQGLNELSAPFILLKKTGLPLARIYQYFTTFVDSIIPNIYADDVLLLYFKIRNFKLCKAALSSTSFCLSTTTSKFISSLTRMASGQNFIPRPGSSHCSPGLALYSYL